MVAHVNHGLKRKDNFYLNGDYTSKINLCYHFNFYKNNTHNIRYYVLIFGYWIKGTKILICFPFIIYQHYYKSLLLIFQRLP